MAPSNVYPCRDGEYLIGANGDGVFRRLCEAMGRSNLADDASCFANSGTNRVVANVGLGQLKDNGGPTRTHALNAVSPAVDGVQGACTNDGTDGGTPITFDQRGYSRPRVGSANGDLAVVAQVGTTASASLTVPVLK